MYDKMYLTPRFVDLIVSSIKRDETNRKRWRSVLPTLVSRGGERANLCYSFKSRDDLARFDEYLSYTMNNNNYWDFFVGTCDKYRTFIPIDGLDDFRRCLLQRDYFLPNKPVEPIAPKVPNLDVLDDWTGGREVKEAYGQAYAQHIAPLKAQIKEALHHSWRVHMGGLLVAVCVLFYCALIPSLAFIPLGLLAYFKTTTVVSLLVSLLIYVVRPLYDGIRGWRAYRHACWEAKAKVIEKLQSEYDRVYKVYLREQEQYKRDEEAYPKKVKEIYADLEYLTALNAHEDLEEQCQALMAVLPFRLCVEQPTEMWPWQVKVMIEKESVSMKVGGALSKLAYQLTLNAQQHLSKESFAIKPDEEDYLSCVLSSKTVEGCYVLLSLLASAAKNKFYRVKQDEQVEKDNNLEKDEQVEETKEGTLLLSLFFKAEVCEQLRKGQKVNDVLFKEEGLNEKEANVVGCGIQ